MRTKNLSPTHSKFFLYVLNEKQFNTLGLMRYSRKFYRSGYLTQICKVKPQSKRTFKKKKCYNNTIKFLDLSCAKWQYYNNEKLLQQQKTRNKNKEYMTDVYYEDKVKCIQWAKIDLEVLICTLGLSIESTQLALFTII